MIDFIGTIRLIHIRIKYIYMDTAGRIDVELDDGKVATAVFEHSQSDDTNASELERVVEEDIDEYLRDMKYVDADALEEAIVMNWPGRLDRLDACIVEPDDGGFVCVHCGDTIARDQWWFHKEICNEQDK